MAANEAAGGEVTDTEDGFSQHAVDIMGAVARFIIPPSDEYALPGADDAAIFSIMVHKAKSQKKRIMAGIRALEQFALDDLNTSLTTENLPAVLNDHQKELRSLTGVMMMVTAQSYYQDPRVLRSLGLPARPPFPKGHEVEQGDWTLLDVVKRRGRVYREA